MNFSKTMLLPLLTVGCAYISDDHEKWRLDPDDDGVAWPDDCDDENETILGERTWFLDADGDGFGDPDISEVACTMPVGYVELNTDCDDSDATIFPNAEDVFYDGVDQDCDGSDDCDADGDGYPSAGTSDGSPTSACPEVTDCDDANSNIYLDASEEVYFNGVDDDCRPETGDGDSDGDGHWHQDYVQISISVGFQALEIPADQSGGDCYDSIAFPVAGFDVDPINGLGALTAAEINPSAIDLHYDGIDQDCTGPVSNDTEFDADGDGYDSATYPNRAGVYGTDCVDREDDADFIPESGLTPAEINPGQAETWYDSQDQNCDGMSDFDQDADLYDSSDYGGTDCNDQNFFVNIESEEVADDGVDQNCDGGEDCYEDLDEDGHGTNITTYSVDLTCLSPGVVPASMAIDGSGLPLDCDDFSAAVNPGAVEICGSIDHDCDQVIGDLDPDADPASKTTFFEDFDGDGFGDVNFSQLECVAPTSNGFDWVTNSTDCNDINLSIFPYAPDSVGAVDENCDGLEDQGYLCQSFSQDGSYYTVCDAEKTAAEANAICLSSPGMYDGLAAVQTIDQNAQLTSAVQTIHSASAFFWTSLTDSITPEVFLWGDGSIPQLNLWANGAPPPDTTDLDCVNSSALLGEWSAVSCDTSAVVVCSGIE